MEFDRSDKVLTIGNLLALLIVVVFGYGFATLVWTYFIESIIIGFFHFLKLIVGVTKKNKTPKLKTANPQITNPNTNELETTKKIPSKSETQNPRLSVLWSPIVFAIHYGMFHIGVVIFLLTLPWFSIGMSALPSVALISWIFISMHGCLFYENVWKRKWSVPSGIRAAKLQFAEPYSKVVPIYLAIIIAGIVLFSDVQQSVVNIMIIMVAKTMADVYIHRRNE
ncbi:hypothetical protein KKF81_05435 [Candidatus Micrarchaeota archaeon]|nr:hypothetical protein [Candidatus Micrarchaeota archaeon]MBU1166370.1 hypothetical protein [Candidatus Micrarchaeota archaeon]MBU1886894.1 hypothetical protein [Candidatus Micrarchaeota archaeon]